MYMCTSYKAFHSLKKNKYVLNAHEKVFTFPKSAKKPLVVKNENIPNTNDNLSDEKSKKNVSHNKTVIVKLRKELSQQTSCTFLKYCMHFLSSNTDY
jgi:hypothetical protein